MPDSAHSTVPPAAAPGADVRRLMARLATLDLDPPTMEFWICAKAASSSRARFLPAPGPRRRRQRPDRLPLNRACSPDWADLPSLVGTYMRNPAAAFCPFHTQRALRAHMG
jgi:hypothetical protein